MKLISIIALIISLTGSSVFAVNTSAVVEAGEMLSAKLTQQIMENGKKGIVLQLMKADGQVAKSIVMESASKAAFERALPSNLSTTLKAQANAAKGFSFKALVAGKAIQFPAEVMGFYVALGAVMTYDLWMNYAQNPVGYEQLNQSQLDPVGQLGFYFFMLGNGAAAEPLSQMIENGKLNRKFAKFIPFIGMGAGTIASNIVHELGHAENLHACAANLLKSGQVTAACDQAMKTWSDNGGFGGLADEHAPSFLSLGASIILSGVAQSGINAGFSFVKSAMVRNGILEIAVKANVKMGLEQVVKIAGIELATSAIPGKVFFKMGKIANIAVNGAVFTFANKIEAPISYAWKTHSISDNIKDITEELDTDIKNLSQPNGAKIITQGHLSRLRAFGEVMKKWKAFNLREVMEARGNWEQYLSKLIISYQAAQAFYSDFLGHQWERKYGKFNTSYTNGTYNEYSEEIFPLNGINLTDSPSQLNEIIVTASDQVEIAQMRTIEGVLNSIRDGSFYKAQNLSALSAEEKQIFNQIISGLSQKTAFAIGKTLEKMNLIISANGGVRYDDFMNCQSPRGCGPTPNALQIHLSAISKALGRPDPIFVKGRGYAKYYQQLANNIETVKKTEYPKNYGSSFGNYRLTTETFAESMFASMLLGPDLRKNESIIYLKNGFAADFRAPKITDDPSLEFYFDGKNGYSRSQLVVDVFKSPMIGGSGHVFNSGFSYLTQSDNGIDSDILNAEPSSFNTWWENRIEKKYISAWDDFAKKYQAIVSKLLSQIKSTDNSIFNVSSANPGILASMRYENNYYFKILNTLAKQAMPQSQNVPQIIELQKATENLMTMLKNISVTLERVPAPQDIDAAYNRLASALNSAGDLFDVDQAGVKSFKIFNPGQKWLALISIQQLRDNMTQVRNYIEIATAATYQTRLNRDGKMKENCEAAVEKSGTSMSANQVMRFAGCGE